MGAVIVPVRLENTLDRHLLRRGQLLAGDVHATTIPILVDTGASSLVLPEDIVTALGIDLLDITTVEHADGRTEERPVAGPVSVEVQGRIRNFDCVVGNAGTEALLGQVVLEMLDLLVDCKNQVLVPRPGSPNRTYYHLK